MKKYIPIIILLLLASSSLTAQTFSDDTFVYTVSPKKAVQSAVLSTLTKAETNQSVTYFDGLGRTVQTTAVGQGGDGSDIITPAEYDAFGRQVKEYLPYSLVSSTTAYPRTTMASSLASLNTLYNASKYDNTSNPFSEKQLESSPLSRVIKQATPGTPWIMGGGHEIKLDYLANAGSEVKFYKAITVWNSELGLYNTSLSDFGTYVENQLYKNVTYDENTTVVPLESAGSTVEFKNKEGQVVLKRTYEAVIKHDTYYVYDVYGNLTYVIPPKADGVITAAVLDNLCYQYKYDYHNRLVEKKLPGKQWEFIVYDQLDRPSATGPANSPFSDLTASGWMITKYDAFGRPIYTGWMNQAVSSAGRNILQTAQNGATVLFETKMVNTIDGISANYSNSNAPMSFKLLTVNYYDNYAYPNAATVPGTVETEPVLTNAKSLLTGSWARIVTTLSAILGETSSTFYDAKARPIEVYTKNYLGGFTYTDSKLDFTGKLAYTITIHKRTAADAELKTKETYTYSAQDRLLTHTHQINEGAVELIESNTYDALGQLVYKKVGNTETAPVQKVDYTYNIRGWLTGINNISGLSQSSDPKDLFAFRLNYNTTPTGIAGVLPLYNGNISETAWKTNSDSGVITRGYGYKYDNLNRLKAAVSYKNSAVVNMYDETLTYDKNGNILSLQRNGASDSVLTAIDNLVYSYGASNTTNLLMKVADSSDKTKGFIDGANTGDDYSYDANGSMISDANKGISMITYNHLNLPAKITFGTTGNIVYIYNAAGQKVQKIVTVLSPASTTVTDYLGGYQYVNAVLKFFPTSEGYIEPVTASSYKYIYQYKDHLGNVRLSYDKNLVIQEENNYYPFGLKQEGYNAVKNSTNDALKYKFQSQERQDELGLNWDSFKWRNYDYAIGRFMCIDPLAEKYQYQSPYNFSENRVVDSRELEGLEKVSVTKKDDDIEPGSFKYEVGMVILNLIGGVGELGAKVDGVEANSFEDRLGHVQSGGLFIIDTSLFFEGLVEMNRAPSEEEFKPNYSKTASETPNATVVNGNSKSSTKAQHGYEITNETKNERHKVGVSGGKLNANGTSRRANSQVNKLNKKGGDKFSAKVKVYNIPDRTEILDWEQFEVDTHFQETKTTPAGQKRPKPTGT